LAEIRLEGVWKVFGKVIAVKEVSLTIQDSEFLVLLGPSGCGKTTTLRCIAGLERVDGGRIFIGEKDVSGMPPGQRGIGMVFQSYAVFPHMKVFDNIAFGLKMKRASKSEIKRRVEDVAQLLQIEELLMRYPAQLSGGQRQRVAVARAIVLEPEVLLMDEPLSNLDALVRLQVRAELKRLHRQIGSTTVYVTHDQVEALSLGDRIAVMNDGEIVQVDEPTVVYEHPANVFVGGFIGNPPMNFLKGRVLPGKDAETITLDVAGERLTLPAEINPQLMEYVDLTVIVGVRAEHLRVSLAPEEGAIPSTVHVVEPLGSHLLLTVEAGGEILKVNAETDLDVEPNQDVWLIFDPGKLRFMDEETSEALRSSRA
jgi:multiple sugar transport system ATP-binding protein